MHTTHPLRWSGYTAIELTVSVAIIAIITSIVVSSRSGFDSTVSLSNLTYDVALVVREAQLYGINVRRAGPTNAFTYQAGYGVRFKTTPYTSSTDASLTSLILFADLNNNRRYDGGGEFLREYKIAGNSSVSSICYVHPGVSGCTYTSLLDVTYRRPDPDACLNTGYALDDRVGDPGVESSSYCLTSPGIVSAQITLRSGNAKPRNVNVYSTGEISVSSEPITKPRPEQIAPVAPPPVDAY